MVVIVGWTATLVVNVTEQQGSGDGILDNLIGEGGLNSNINDEGGLNTNFSGEQFCKKDTPSVLEIMPLIHKTKTKSAKYRCGLSGAWEVPRKIPYSNKVHISFKHIHRHTVIHSHSRTHSITHTRLTHTYICTVTHTCIHAHILTLTSHKHEHTLIVSNLIFAPFY